MLRIGGGRGLGGRLGSGATRATQLRASLVEEDGAGGERRGKRRRERELHENAVARSHLVCARGFGASGVSWCLLRGECEWERSEG